MPLLLLLTVADGDEAPLSEDAANNVNSGHLVLFLSLFILFACR